MMTLCLSAANSRERLSAATRRARGMASAFFVIVMLLTACSGQGAEGSGSSASDTLKIGFIVPPTSMDPGKANTGNAHWYYTLAYDSLIYLDHDGNLQPRLAESWRYVGTGNKTFELKLRPDIKFSDGASLTAEGFKAHIDYYRKNSPGAALLGSFKSVEVVDPRTVRIRLSEPHPQLPTLFTQYFGVSYVISPKALKRPAALAKQTFGAGPYMLKPSDTVAEDHYTYVRNPHYWDKANVHYKTVVIKVMSNPNTALAAVKTGQVDVIRGEYTTANAAKSAGLQVSHAPLNFVGLALADRDGKLVPALGDVRVRQALNYAVDREKITNGLFGEFGTPTDQIQLPGQDGRNEKSFYRHDPQKARKLLAEAGFADGFTLPVVATTEQGAGLVVQAIADDLKQVGVRVELKTEANTANYFKEMTSGKWPAFGILFGSLPIHIEGPVLFLPGGPFNPLKSSDARLQSLYKEAAAASATDSPELNQQIIARLVEQGWFMPVVHAPVFFYARPNVAGVESTPKGWFANPVEWRPAG